MGKISNEMTCFLTRTGFRIYFLSVHSSTLYSFSLFSDGRVGGQASFVGGFNPQVVSWQRGVDRYHHYDDDSTGCSTAFFVMPAAAAVDNSSGLLKGHKGHQLPFL